MIAWWFQRTRVWQSHLLAPASGAFGTRTACALPSVERLSSAVSRIIKRKAIENNRSTLEPGSTGKACDAQRPEAQVIAWWFQRTRVWQSHLLAPASGACGTRTACVLPSVERLSSAVSRIIKRKAIENDRSTLEPGSTGEACDAQRPEAQVIAWWFQRTRVWQSHLLAPASGACGTRTAYVLPSVERLSSAVSRIIKRKAIEDNRSTREPGSTGEACDAQRPEAIVNAWWFQCTQAWQSHILAPASGACGTRTAYVLPSVERLSSAVS